jgi:hypothetical protein
MVCQASLRERRPLWTTLENWTLTDLDCRDRRNGTVNGPAGQGRPEPKYGWRQRAGGCDW